MAEEHHHEGRAFALWRALQEAPHPLRIEGAWVHGRRYKQSDAQWSLAYRRWFEMVRLPAMFESSVPALEQRLLQDEMHIKECHRLLARCADLLRQPTLLREIERTVGGPIADITEAMEVPD